MPAKAGIHTADWGVFGFPLEFIPFFIRDGNDNVTRRPGSRCLLA